MTNDLEHWVTQGSERWRAIEQALPGLDDTQPVDVAQLRRALADYPELARDLAIARRALPRSRVTAYLEKLYAGLHRALYRPPGMTLAAGRVLFAREIPAVAWRLKWQIVCITLGFALAALCGWWLVMQYPELASLFASEAMIEQVERGELWTDGLLNIVPSSVLSVQIFTNNILVALTTLALGVLYGLGTLYIIGLNGFMIGGVFALTAQHGMADALFKFVAAHGPVELTVICISGAIGFSLGEALARPGHLPRGVAFQQAVHRGARLMLLCVVFLVGAGLIEGYVSPDPDFPLWFRVGVGLAYWCLLLVALTGWRWPGRGLKPGAGA